MERKFSLSELPFIGKKIRDNSQYELRDNSFLENLVVSYTMLKGGQATNGHKHDNEEEVYVFTDGYGDMQIDETFYPVEKGDVVLIKKGEFHKVLNDSDHHPLCFMAIFQKYEGRG